MKNIKESLLERAHLFIMVITLVITCVGLEVRLPRSTSSYAAFSSYGYVPMSAVDAEQNALVPHDLQQRQSNFGSEFAYVQKSIQYAVDTEQQVFVQAI